MMKEIFYGKYGGFMLVRELIIQLAKFNPESTAILSNDVEGNGYRHVDSLYAGIYDDGEVYIKSPYTVEQGGEACVVLF